MLQRSFSRQEGTGKKLPPTPSKPSSVILGRKPASLPATPGRQLPRTRTPSEESYYKSEYNEDYNHAYRSDDNLQQESFTDTIYPDQMYNQSHISGSIRDNQYVPEHIVPQVSEQYGQSYQDPTTQDLYVQGQQSYAQNSYKDAYQAPYLDTNTQIYQEPYQDTTYPKISAASDQYEKPQDIAMSNNYQTMDYDQNNIQQLTTQKNLMTQDLLTQQQVPTSQQYQQEYALDNFQEVYSDYTAPVATSLYDHNNTSNAYDPYQQNLCDNKYQVPISDAYQDSYDQPAVSISQEGYSESYGTHDTYQDTYQEKQDYEKYIPYSKSEDTTDFKSDYRNEYQDYTEQYDESYQDSYQGSFEEYNKENLGISNERRKSEVPELSVTTPRGQTKTNGYPSSESDYYYPCQDKPEISSTGAARRRKLVKRDTSPLFQQNTDSLESRDDELKDSFETAVSSVSSSQPRKAYSEYSTAGESSPAPATLVESPPNSVQVSNGMMNHANTITTSASVYPSISTNGKRFSRTDSYQQDMIEDEYPEIISNDLQRKDSQMSHQSQLSQHSSQQSQKPKLTRGESYASDQYSEDGYTDRRDSYAQPTRKDSYASINQEGFKPPLQRTESYQSREPGRGSVYGQNFTTPQPISRAESYKRGYFKDQDSMDKTEISLSNAVNGDYKMRDETLER